MELQDFGIDSKQKGPRDRNLLEQVKPVTIDYSEMGFRISSTLEPSGGCRTCGTAGSCCGT